MPCHESGKDLVSNADRAEMNSEQVEAVVQAEELAGGGCATSTSIGNRAGNECSRSHAFHSPKIPKEIHCYWYLHLLTPGYHQNSPKSAPRNSHLAVLDIVLAKPRWSPDVESLIILLRQCQSSCIR